MTPNEVTDIPSDGPRLGATLDLGPVVQLTEAFPKSVPYNPDKDRESARGLLAYSLMALTCVVALALITLAAVYVRPFDKELLGLLISGVLTPVVALVGTVIGFYFGQSSGNARS